MNIILASASPRRKELMELAGYHFEVRVSDAEEIITKSEPQEVVEELSQLKARDVAKDAPDDTIVIGADTIVTSNGVILGKPHNREHAIAMLTHLQGRVHEVYTGVTLVCKKDGKVEEKTFAERTEVHFYPMTMEEIEAYVDTLDCMDKAGAYGIQSGAAVYIEKINGDYNNVVGLPIARLYHEMTDLLK